MEQNHQDNAQTKTWRLVQVTDPHIGPTRDYQLAGIETYESFRVILAELGGQDPRPDMIYVTGDIAAAGAPGAYKLFTQQMQFLDLPYGWLPGNHDEVAYMQEAFSSAAYWPVLEMGPWRIICLNTTLPNAVGGELSDSELTFLERALDSEPDSPVILFMHHPPVPVGCEWLDKQRISNADKLEAIVRASGNVKAAFTGHVHQEFVTQWAGCELRTTPSTCFQFLAGSRHFAISKQAPGYRWIDLHSNGEFETGIVSVKNARQAVNHEAVGY